MEKRSPTTVVNKSRPELAQKASPKPGPRSLSQTIKDHPLAIAFSLFFSFLLGTATVFPAVVAGFEKWNETIPIIDMGGIDPKKPFSAPLEIKNGSTIFDMHSPAIDCKFSAFYSDGAITEITQNGGTIGWHGLPRMTVPIKSSAVFFCDIPDKLKYTNEAGKELTLQSATMTVSVKYETWIGFIIRERQPPSTVFTFLNTSNGYQWLKGTLIK